VARVFVGTTISITSWVGATNWGKDLSGSLVDTQAKWQAAVAALRTPNGRDPNYAWTNPTKWTKFETDLATNTKYNGNYNDTMAGLKSMNVEPLMVVAVGGRCDVAQRGAARRSAAQRGAARCH
jgi:hypothetical protein